MRTRMPLCRGLCRFCRPRVRHLFQYAFCRRGQPCLFWIPRVAFSLSQLLHCSFVFLISLGDFFCLCRLWKKGEPGCCPGVKWFKTPSYSVGSSPPVLEPLCT